MRYLLSIMLALLAPSLAYSQSVKVLDPSTGLPVFSAANPANVTIVGGGSGSSGTVAQASTTSGQSGMLDQCAVTTGVPTYTTATTNPLNCTTNGALRSTLVGTTGGLGQVGTTTNDTTGAQSGLFVFSQGQVFDGTNWPRMRGDSNGTVTEPGLSATAWTYTSGTTPILANTTTAVTIKAAAGASVRNMIDACQLTTTAFGASVPLAIRDGAGGTVIWALTVPTAGFLQPVTLTFPMPLRGTANTLLEVVTTTANTSGSVTLSCQGHTGS